MSNHQPCGNSAPVPNYGLPGEYDPHKQPLILCEWHKLVRLLSKRMIKLCRLDISPCNEEGTEKIETCGGLGEDYLVCPMHCKIWQGLSEE